MLKKFYGQLLVSRDETSRIRIRFSNFRLPSFLSQKLKELSNNHIVDRELSLS